MLTKIREKSQGAFAGIILAAICIPFALWGINNYTNDASETPVASVGDKDFYQRDLMRAYEKYRQNFRNVPFDEKQLKAQALNKLVKDEVLLQYVNSKKLTVSDETVRDFLKNLPYFQTDGKFDETKYKTLLSSQRMTSVDFVKQVKNELEMEQLQKTVLESGFATNYDVERFFKIQNQKRDAQYVIVSPQLTLENPKDNEISAYYQQNQNKYKIPEQVAIQYIELTLDDVAKTIEVTDEKLKAFYEEQKELFIIPERRKISHILFAIKEGVDEKTALSKAQEAKQSLINKDFSALAKEISDDKLSAKEGGDLGLFNAGVMEKEFEQAVEKLALNEVSNPVKSAFGYHLIKVTELLPKQVKSLENVKEEVTKAYQKAQAETLFYQKGETLTEMSYQNSDSLQVAADTLQLKIQTTPLFTKDNGEGLANDEKIRTVAFSEDVLQGINSTPIEIGNEKLVVLRVAEHKPAAIQELEKVKPAVIQGLLAEKSEKSVIENTQKIKLRLNAGESIENVAKEYKLEVKKLTNLARNQKEIPLQLREAIFKAAKPVANKATITTVTLPDQTQAIVSISKVTEGVMSEEDKKQMTLALQNLGNALAQVEFNGLVDTLQSMTDISIQNAQ